MKKNKRKLRLFFLSGEDTSDNKPALKHLKKTLKNKQSVTFIPSQKYDTKKEFIQLKKDFKKIGFSDFTYMPLDKGFIKADFLNALKSDVIFLGGGNTFYFMDCINKLRISSSLKKFAQSGGVLMGLSAGAIIMTPHVLLGGFPREDADDNDVNLTKINGLNLVSFEVCPHYQNNKRMINNLSAYSALYKNPVYGIKDGDFLYVEDDKVLLNGKIPMFKSGEKINLS